jgi:hypothetical protein
VVVRYDVFIIIGVVRMFFELFSHHLKSLRSLQFRVIYFQDWLSFLAESFKRCLESPFRMPLLFSIKYPQRSLYSAGMLELPHISINILFWKFLLFFSSIPL